MLQFARCCFTVSRYQMMTMVPTLVWWWTFAFAESRRSTISLYPFSLAETSTVWPLVWMRL